MKVGDLVKNLKSERGLSGIIVDWTDNVWPDNNQGANHPVILWSAGHTSWIESYYLEVLNASH
mgnify:CR=1 FL=1